MATSLLKRFTIAVTGDFGQQRTTEKVRQWIHYHGGTFASEMSPTVTHLICSKQHYGKAVPKVKQALKLKTVKIVKFDWLEDSLLSKPPRVRNEREYLMGTIIGTARESKTRKKAARKHNIKKGMATFEKGCKDFEQDMFSDGYHIYRDSTTFAYDITLARINLLTNKNQRYSLKVNEPASDDPSPSPIISNPIFPSLLPSPRPRARIHHARAQRLQLYESHATPKLYACYAKYSGPKQSSIPRILAPLGSSFELAFGNFKQFFTLKTRKEWDDRLVKANMGSIKWGLQCDACGGDTGALQLCY
ncbi:MAG: hypothetical protein Q9217_002254 [Psora testacea]